jgi:hypothetical protein
MRHPVGVRGSLSFTIVLALSAAMPAQAAPDDRDRTFNDALLDLLVGRWNVSREIRGKQERNTLDVEWVLLHQFLQLHFKDIAEPPQYEAIVLIGYDRAAQRYVIHWCDTFGGKFSLTGHGRRSGDSIEFVFEGPDSSLLQHVYSRSSNRPLDIPAGEPGRGRETRVLREGHPLQAMIDHGRRVPGRGNGA